jgi:ribonuclease PH
MRVDNRKTGDLRPVEIIPGYLMTAEGSALIKAGNTHVLCAASVEDTVPPFLRNSGKGWVTAEYSMLPRATARRSPREVSKGRPSGRTHEIQRLIGRSLRAVLRGFAFGEHTIRVDCDVLQADGGTRTAAITGAAVALADATAWLARTAGVADPFAGLVAGVSVGVVDGEPRLDLCYAEDRDAQVDANVVVADPDLLVEVQGTAEHGTFGRAQLDQLLDLAQSGVSRIFAAQRATLGR